MKADDDANERIAQLLTELFGGLEDAAHVNYVFVAVDDRVPIRQVITDLQPLAAIEFLQANIKVILSQEIAARPREGAN